MSDLLLRYGIDTLIFLHNHHADEQHSISPWETVRKEKNVSKSNYETRVLNGIIGGNKIYIFMKQYAIC